MNTKFEQEAKAYRRLNNPSWEHTGITYTKGKPDYFLMIVSAFLIGFGIVALLTII